jgi:hypothetical protein
LEFGVRRFKLRLCLALPSFEKRCGQTIRSSESLLPYPTCHSRSCPLQALTCVWFREWLGIALPIAWLEASLQRIHPEIAFHYVYLWADT